MSLFANFLEFDFPERMKSQVQNLNLSSRGVGAPAAAAQADELAGAAGLARHTRAGTATTCTGYLARR